MSAKVYLVLSSVNKKPMQIASILKTKAGVITVDVLDGYPNLIAILEAESRQELAELTAQAIDSVETMTKSLQLLPVMLYEQ